MSLTSKQRSFLRGEAHHLSPVVMVGKVGLTESVLKAMYQALRSHELIKIKIPADDQEAFREAVANILKECQGAEKVQTIGHLLVVFRPSTPAGKISKKLKAEKMPYTRATIEESSDTEGSSHQEEE